MQLKSFISHSINLIDAEPNESICEILCAKMESFAAEKQQFPSVDLSESVLIGSGMEEGGVNIQKQSLKKMNENKLRCKKLKLKLISLSNQAYERCLIRQIKDTTSPNKSRLMKLAIQLEKNIQIQTKDYAAIESIFKEIQKIIDHKREHDLLILRQSKFVSALSALLKKYPSFHKNEVMQSTQSIELGLKLLKTFVSLSQNRQFLITDNQILAITALLGCSLSKEDNKISNYCLSILNSIFSANIRVQLEQIIGITLQVIFCSQVIKKLKVKMQTVAGEQEERVDNEFLLSSSKFIFLSIFRFSIRQFERATYEQALYGSSLSKLVSGYFEGIIQTYIHLLVCMIYDQDEEGYYLRDTEISNGTINIFLYIFKTFNALFHLNLSASQSYFDCSCPQILEGIKFIFEYCKQNLKQTAELTHLCSQIMIFLGNLSLQNSANQDILRKCGLLQSLYNHPLEYIMQNSLKTIYITSMCCTLYNNKENINEAFKQTSAKIITKFVEKEMETNKCRKEDEEMQQSCTNLNLPSSKFLSRNASHSSINSNYSKASMAQSFSTQASCNISGSFHSYFRLEHKFRQRFWKGFIQEIKIHE